MHAKIDVGEPEHMQDELERLLETKYGILNKLLAAKLLWLTIRLKLRLIASYKPAEKLYETLKSVIIASILFKQYSMHL